MNAKLIGGSLPLHRHPLGFIEAFCSLGASQDRLLRDTGISPAMFEMQEINIGFEQFQRLLYNGIEACSRPALGVAVGMRFDWSYWGPVGFVVHCSPSLKLAGEAFRRYLVMSQPHYATHTARPNAYLDADNRVVEPIDYATGSEQQTVLRDFIRDWRQAVTLRLWDLCGNKEVDDPSVHVRLDRPRPAEPTAYRSLPCESLTFDCDEFSISAHRDFVFRRFRPLRKRTFDRIIDDCERELCRVPERLPFTERVRSHMRAHFRPDLNLETVARQLHLTPRSLSRRLARERSSFRHLLHAVRMEITSYQLRNSRPAVEEVAALAGFSCASSLRRAVKSWTGVTVGQIRAVME